MKLKFYLLSMAAAFAFAGCTSDDSISDGDGKNNDGMVTRYLSVNIVPASSSPAMRNAIQQTGDPNTATYEDGTEVENKVEKVRFYFFKADGSAANVKDFSVANNYGMTIVDFRNYYDCEIKATNNTDNPNIEKILNTTIVINTEDGDSEAPAQIFAVLNPPTTLGEKSLSLNDLRNKTTDFAFSNQAKVSSFVMTNSAYLDAGGNEMFATPIEGKNLCTSEDAAKKAPVTIYVERAMAKVRLKISLNITDEPVAKKIYNFDDYIPLKCQIWVSDKLKHYIFLKVNNWGLTATTNNAYLGKHISKDWTEQNIFTNWNWYPYFRSYWGYNPENAGQDYLKYSAINQQFSTTPAAIYTNENAGKSSTDAKQRNYPTQFIIAGQIGYMDNSDKFQALEYAEYMGKKLVGEKALKTAMVNYVTLYKKTTTTGNDNSTTTTYTKIGPDDVKLITGTTANNYNAGQGATNADGNRCKVYLAPADAQNGQTAPDWYASNVNDDKNNPALTEAQVKEALMAAGSAMLWKNGQTYYYGKIQHLNQPAQGAETGTETSVAEQTGQYGVVRNHIYDITINKIVGLGTPVYDVNEVIYPEKPNREETYIAADVKILSWRVVPSNVELVW